MTPDPHAHRKVVKCTTTEELQALIQGWRDQGIPVTGEVDQAARDTWRALAKRERGAR